MSGQKDRRRAAVSKRTAEYQYGNTVRQLQAVPKQKNTPEIEKPRLSNRARRNRDKALYMSFGYVMFLAAAAVITLTVCVSYVYLKADMTQRVNHISSLEKQLANLKSENNETYNRINNSVDLDYIKKVALEELGMVYATEEQVRLYESEDSDYVRQYENIPKAEPSK